MPQPQPARTQLSVIVPTYNEPPGNIHKLCERLFAAAAQQSPRLDIELLILDDESSGSAVLAAKVEELARANFNIRLMARKRSEGRGLSSAVLLGLRGARHEAMLVMDADLQHEPESVPAVAAPVLQRKADFSVGSRNVAGGKVAAWSASRKLISSVATLLAWPVTTCRDPMSGFFCLDKETLSKAACVHQPVVIVVWSILLLLLLHCPGSPSTSPHVTHARTHRRSHQSADT
jgi:dolichol-phosphate mannosyltransferase